MQISILDYGAAALYHSFKSFLKIQYQNFAPLLHIQFSHGVSYYPIEKLN